MWGIRIKEDKEHIVIKWMLSRIKIPKNTITNLYFDNTYSGKEADAVRIGIPGGTMRQLFIETTAKNYVLFTYNEQQYARRIQKMIEENNNTV
ncbi:hypothetical protein [uncultured Marinococcus sp.]|uniref:SunI/YnzG family protein n=1 Tax=uncultured Marinococcus sp. TaxID=487012 RepID=UPI00260B25AC|nr:hypothetical protein [uncultured Marinococcus sp.]